MDNCAGVDGRLCPRDKRSLQRLNSPLEELPGCYGVIYAEFRRGGKRRGDAISPPENLTSARHTRFYRQSAETRMPCGYGRLGTQMNGADIYGYRALECAAVRLRHIYP